MGLGLGLGLGLEPPPHQVRLGNLSGTQSTIIFLAATWLGLGLGLAFELGLGLGLGLGLDHRLGSDLVDGEEAEAEGRA